MTANNRNKTTFLTKEQAGESNKQWFVFDASGKTLGRLAAEIVKVLRGKHKPTFAPHTDVGDGVIVINADKVAVTGAKEAQKIYRYYTGSMGGLREIPYRAMMARKPEYIIRHAVWGMMSTKTSMARAQLKRLRIFAGDNHLMQAQKPISVNI